MTNKKLIYLVILLVLVAMLGVGLVQAQESETALQGLLDQQVQEQDILGMAMAVRLADGTVIGKASGYSDPSGDEAWSVDTVSAIGSVTKTYTAVVVMQLVEEGKLSLDDTIDTWFPEQSDGDRITVRMLLSHTSGLANYLSAQNVMEGKWNKEWVPMDLVAEANKIGPVGEPGSSEVHYSNTNFILLGLIVEEITGNSWAQEVESRIIKSLGLKDTTFLRKEGILDIMVGAYTKMEYGTQNLLESGYQNLLDEQWYPHPSTVWSAGEIVTTLSDLMTFVSALFDGKLVSRETLVVMAQPIATDVDSGILWSLGGVTLDMGSLRAFGMGGDIPGYHAFFVGVLDTKLIVTALVNTQEGDVIMPSISALEYISQSLSGAPDEPGAAREIQAPDYQKIIDEVLQDDRPGIALRVITPKFEISETRGYADWENKIPLEEDHLFRVASCTKTFIATLTLMMHFEGGLDLDDAITRYLPETITNRIQYADQITIRQMLNHTSGIFNTGDNPEYWAAQYGDPTKEWTDTEVLEFALDRPAYFETSSFRRCEKSNPGAAGTQLDFL
jgi:D-alanyl-D-alanine carboxypeptidase